MSPKTNASAPKLIPKGVLGTSIWVETLVGKLLGHQPVERLLTQWRLLGLSMAAGTVNEGLKRLEPMFVPLYEARRVRNAQSALIQADETRWMVFIDHEGKTGHRWWLTWYLESCAEAGGQAPADISQFSPWNLSPGKLRELAITQPNTS